MINPPNAATIAANSQYVNGVVFSVTGSWISISNDLGESWSEGSNPFGTTQIGNIVWNGSKYGVIEEFYPYRFMYSSDGLAWTGVDLSTLVAALNDAELTVADGYFVVSSYIGDTVISDNGATWTRLGLDSSNRSYRPIPASSGFACLVTDKATGRDGIATTSTPGGTWSAVALIPVGTVYMASGNGSHVVRISTGIKHSENNGSSWTDNTFPADTYGTNSLVFGNNKWVSGGQGFGQIRVADTSFTLTNSPNAGFSSVYDNSVSVAYDGTQWIALSHLNEIATSPNAVAWTLRTNPGFVVGNLVSGGGVTLANTTSAGNSFARTTDGITWTQVTIPDTDYENSPLISYAGSLFVLNFFTSNRMFTSSDGLTWTEKTAFLAGSYVTYASGYWLLPGAAFTQDFITYTATQRMVTPGRAAVSATPTKVVYFAGGDLGSQTLSSTFPFVWTKVGNADLPYGVSLDSIWGTASLNENVLSWVRDQSTGFPEIFVTADGAVWSAPTEVGIESADSVWLHASSSAFYVLTFKDLSYGYNQDVTVRMYSSTDGVTWGLLHTELGLESVKLLFAAEGCFYLEDTSGFFTMCGTPPACIPFWTNHTGQREVVL